MHTSLAHAHVGGAENAEASLLYCARPTPRGRGWAVGALSWSLWCVLRGSCQASCYSLARAGGGGEGQSPDSPGPIFEWCLMATAGGGGAAVLAQAARSTGACELRGSVDIPAPVNNGATDGRNGDAAAFCATYWSATLPHGYATARQRVESAYDEDVLEVFRELVKAEQEYAGALQRLSERVCRDPYSDKGGFAGWFRGKEAGAPLVRNMQYASMQHAWSAMQSLIQDQAHAHRACSEEMRSNVIEPLKAAVKEASYRHAESIEPIDQRLEQVRFAREQTQAKAGQYAHALRKFRKEHASSSSARPPPTRPAVAQWPSARRPGAATEAKRPSADSLLSSPHHPAHAWGAGASLSSSEAVLLHEAAKACAESVADANARTRRFEAEEAPPALDALQEHEERRLEAVEQGARRRA